MVRRTNAPDLKRRQEAERKVEILAEAEVILWMKRREVSITVC